MEADIDTIVTFSANSKKNNVNGKVNIEKKKWYEFQNHKWVIVQSAYTLENLISDELRQMFITFWHEKVGEHLKSGDGKYGDAQYKQHNTIQKTFEKLNSNSIISLFFWFMPNLYLKIK